MNQSADLQSLSDRELMQAVATDDRAAFTVFYDRHWARLFTVAYNYTRSRETAQEMVQELFVTVWMKRAELQIRDDFERYLFSAIRHKVYDYHDKQATQTRYAEYATYHLPTAEDTTEQQLSFEETTALINEQVDAFPETTRKVFVLSRFEGLSVVQIADALHLSPKAVEYHITKALRQLRLRLTDVLTLLLATWL